MPSHDLSGISTGKTSSQTSGQTDSDPLTRTRQPVYRRKITISYLPMVTKANKTGTVPLRCVVRWHGQEILFQPGELVTLTERKGGRLVKLWDNKAHALPGHPMAFELNARLAKRAKEIAEHFYGLWDATPFEQVSRSAMLAKLYPASDKPAHLRPAETRTFRELLEWKHLNRYLAEDSLRKYDQLATEMERWAPELRPAAMTEQLAREYLHHLLDRQMSDATIKVHFTALRKCYERLGKATTP
jgi:hypothetical protein